MLVELCVLTAAYQEHRKAREDPKDKKKTKKALRSLCRVKPSRNDIRHSWNLYSAHSNPTQQMERFSNSLKREG